MLLPAAKSVTDRDLPFLPLEDPKPAQDPAPCIVEDPDGAARSSSLRDSGGIGSGVQPDLK